MTVWNWTKRRGNCWKSRFNNHAWRAGKFDVIPVRRCGWGIKMIPKNRWEWYGFSGHFCCGQWCRFHMTTKIGKFVISTVGKFVHPRNSGASEKTESDYMIENPNGEQIGYGRFYETMVFRAGKKCVSNGCNCGQPKIASNELDTMGYNDAGSATRGHLSMCNKWAKKQ